MIELCNIGMRQATAALGRLIGKEVSMEAPRLLRLDEAESTQMLPGEQATAVRLGICGSWGGTMLIVLGPQDTRLMLEFLLGDPGAEQPLSELQTSALLEVGNIMASACLNAVAVMMKTALLPSVPTLLGGEAADLLKQAAEDQQTAAAVAATFRIAGTACSGTIFLIPEQVTTA